MSREEKRVQVVTLKNQGISNKNIGHITGLNERSIRKICQRVKHTQSFKDRRRSGRPPKLSERDKRLSVILLKKKEAKTATGVSKLLRDHHNIQVSRQTVSRAFKEFGFSCRIKKKKPKLTENHKKARLAWAKKYEAWTADDWRNVIWSDESKFNLMNSDGKEYFWTDRPSEITDDAVTPTLKFGGGGVMIWCCMTWEGKQFPSNEFINTDKINILSNFFHLSHFL
jgi:transposase